MTHLWPRLSHADAERLFLSMIDAPIEVLTERAATSHERAAAAPVGGVPVAESTVSELRDGVLEIARRHGFPREMKRHDVSAFDQEATGFFVRHMDLCEADSAAEEVWNFVSLVVLPDVAAWRFPSRNRERLTGHPRNAFRRLWWRGAVVGSDLIDNDRGLGEDELVGIMERPTIASSRRTSRNFAAFAVLFGDTSGVARSELMREMSKRVLRVQSHRNIEILSEAALTRTLTEIYYRSVASLTGRTLHDCGQTPRWMPDPTCRHRWRYWSGAQWTDHVFDAEGGDQGIDEEGRAHVAELNAEILRQAVPATPPPPPPAAGM